MTQEKILPHFNVFESHCTGAKTDAHLLNLARKFSVKLLLGCFQPKNCEGTWPSMARETPENKPGQKTRTFWLSFQ